MLMITSIFIGQFKLIDLMEYVLIIGRKIDMNKGNFLESGGRGWEMCTEHSYLISCVLLFSEFNTFNFVKENGTDLDINYEISWQEPKTYNWFLTDWNNILACCWGDSNSNIGCFLRNCNHVFACIIKFIISVIN